MTIHFYLNDGDETPIDSLYDMQSNPFNVGDVIHLSVEELYPADVEKYNMRFKEKAYTDNENLIKQFNRQAVKIVKEHKSLAFKLLNESRITIEYFCEFLEDEEE